jgi:hypothetical protein
VAGAGAGGDPWIAQLRAGDAAALERLASQEAPRAARLLGSMLGPPQDMERHAAPRLHVVQRARLLHVRRRVQLRRQLQPRGLHALIAQRSDTRDHARASR